MSRLELVAALTLFVLFGCQSSRSEDRPTGGAHAPVESTAKGHPGEVRLSREALDRAGIRVAVAERRALRSGLAIPAEVQFEPSSTAHIGPLVPGRITKVSAALGDRVVRGQLLGIVASIDVSAARARLDQTRARLAAAESTLRRQEQLATEGIGAQRFLIDAEAQVGELRAEVEGLRRQLSVFGSGSAGELTLTAPIDGVVVAVHATLGETVTPEQPAFIVTDPTKVWVRGNVPELELAHVQVGMVVVVRLHAFPEMSMSGKLVYAAPALDERTRSLPVRITLEAPDPRLKSGLFGSIELLGGPAKDRALVVPAEAVATLEGQSVVFLSGGDDSFRPQPVVLGQRAGGLVEVRSGLADGARIATSGAFVLKSALSRSELLGDHDH